MKTFTKKLKGLYGNKIHFIKKTIFFILIFFSSLLVSKIKAQNSIQISVLEHAVTRLLEKENNVFEYYIDSDMVIFENEKNNTFRRPLKNQEVLLILLNNKDHRNNISTMLNDSKINRLRVVYCNTYAIFFMNENKVLHTFFINKLDDKFKIKGFKS